MVVYHYLKKLSFIIYTINVIYDGQKPKNCYCYFTCFIIDLDFVSIKSLYD